MDGRPSPGLLRAFRDRYVASFGGVSYDLAPRAVGVHPAHLARVPELEGREVLVTHDQGRPGPLSRRPSFQVVPLRDGMRDALGRSAMGVVFSVFDLEDPVAGPLLGELALGNPVFINSALDRLGGDVIRRPGTAA